LFIFRYWQRNIRPRPQQLLKVSCECGLKLAAIRPDSRLLSSEFNAFSFGSLPNLRQAGIPETQKTIAFWLPTLLQAK